MLHSRDYEELLPYEMWRHFPCFRRKGRGDLFVAYLLLGPEDGGVTFLPDGGTFAQTIRSQIAEDCVLKQHAHSIYRETLQEKINLVGFFVDYLITDLGGGADNHS
jgi:hypothetical protein